MLARLFLLFTIIPLVELVLLIQIGKATSAWFAIALAILPGLLGAWLVRREGVRCLREVRRQIAEGGLPAACLLDGLLILIAGVLLITPGVLTDLAGFALLIRPVRRGVRLWLTERLRTRVITVVSGGGQRPLRPSKIIDAHVVQPKNEHQE